MIREIVFWRKKDIKHELFFIFDYPENKGFKFQLSEE